MRPLISYYGGKQRMAHHIIPLLPAHITYVEPFAGGAAILFAKGRPTGNPKYCEVINDHNDDLIALYRVAKSRQTRGRFVDMVQATLYSRAEQARAKQILRDGTTDEVLRAWAVYVSINCGFSNKMNSGWKYGPEKDRPKHWQHKIQRLDVQIKRLAEVHVDSLDALGCIGRWDSPSTLFYCDPPYVGADQGHYGGYTADDFQELLNALDQVVGAWVLSCDGRSLDGMALPAGCVKHEITVKTSAKGQIGNTGAERSQKGFARETRVEVILTRERTAPVREDHQRYLWRPIPEQIGLFK